MRVLVFGRSGQVATELARRLPAGVTARFLGRDEADLTDPAACAARVADCDAVINAAAWTAVDKAEAEEPAATLVNAEPRRHRAGLRRIGRALPACLDRLCLRRRRHGPVPPRSSTGPLGAYGRSKLAGEQGVRAAGGTHLILRTSWVVSAHGANFVKTMLRLGRDRDSLNVVADQVGGPTPAAAIADALFAAAQAMAAGAPGGTHHFSGAPDVSWADFAREIMAQARLACAVNDIPTSAYPTPARRPSNSRMDCSAFTAAFGVQRPDWRAGLGDILKELGA